MAERTTLSQKQAGAASRPEQTRGGVFFTPRVDILETDTELIVYADVPGVRADDVELRYERGELTVHGKVAARERPGQPLLAEYEEGDFFRTFTIHESVDSSKIEASCKNGVLVIHLLKVASAQPRQINVRGG